MKKTIISSFYNEEYLLPWWLEHHKNMFDHGIMIDYDSTDESVNIIKSICPDWDIVVSRNKEFGAVVVDQEVMDIEQNISGWKTCLNTTEFLIGDLSVLDCEESLITFPCFAMVDNEPGVLPTYELPLVEQKLHGIHYKEGSFAIRRARSMHRYDRIEYPLGRHFESYNTEKLAVLWYGFSPFNAAVAKRKMQIQNKMPESDKAGGLGTGHILDHKKLNSYYEQYLNMSRDLSKDLREYIL